MFPPENGTSHPPRRSDHRTILHFDYDCFYAAVHEVADPFLKTKPLAIQQKQIIVTCNYTARRRGLYKLQLVTEARRVCPDVIIILGEDLTRFRDASKELYRFLRRFSWNGKVERLGFDEVWMDVSDCVEFNEELGGGRGGKGFFHLDREDPMNGFEYDGDFVMGHVWPADAGATAAENNDNSKEGREEEHADHEDPDEAWKGISTALPSSSDHILSSDDDDEGLIGRLKLASHLAMHIRLKMEETLGYTATVGISTSKLLSKLIGNVNKPRGETTLLPPYSSNMTGVSNAQNFMDVHDIGAIPGIGFKMAQKIRESFLGRRAEFTEGLVYGRSKEGVTVAHVRRATGIDEKYLEKILAGPGSPHGIGSKIWGLLHGVDDSEVQDAREFPRQISIEDSYVRLDTFAQVMDQLQSLSQRLIERMRIDLMESFDATESQMDNTEQKDRSEKTWIAKPSTLRLTTRPRLPLNADGSRDRIFKRYSRSMPVPTFLFNLNEMPEVLAGRLVHDQLLVLFKKLHPERSGWNLSLVNVAVTDMSDSGGESKTAKGRDIGTMFKTQERTLEPFRVKVDTSCDDSDRNLNESNDYHTEDSRVADILVAIPEAEDAWEQDEDNDAEGEDDEPGEACAICGNVVPTFAVEAHRRFHLDEG